MSVCKYHIIFGNTSLILRHIQKLYIKCKLTSFDGDEVGD